MAYSVFSFLLFFALVNIRLHARTKVPCHGCYSHGLILITYGRENDLFFNPWDFSYLFPTHFMIYYPLELGGDGDFPYYFSFLQVNTFLAHIKTFLLLFLTYPWFFVCVCVSTHPWSCKWTGFISLLLYTSMARLCTKTEEIHSKNQ